MLTHGRHPRLPPSQSRDSWLPAQPGEYRLCRDLREGRWRLALLWQGLSAPYEPSVYFVTEVVVLPGTALFLSVVRMFLRASWSQGSLKAEDESQVSEERSPTGISSGTHSHSHTILVWSSMEILLYLDLKIIDK